MIVKANAKINIALNIVSQLDNGYHEMNMVMLPIDIYDTICIEESSFDEIIGFSEIKMEDNIMYKALDMIRKEYDIKKNVKITIEKKIPHQAGLGGGSSDAAAILKALNEMWQLNLSEERLIDLGLQIGADVPFFIINKPANVRGIGERVYPFLPKKTLHGVIVKPCFGFNTSYMFAKVKDYESKAFEIEKLITALISGLKIKDISKSLFFNDFEEVCDDRIQKIKSDLIVNGVKAAVMSGAGSSIVGLVDTMEEAEYLEKKLKNQYNFVQRFKVI